MDRCLVQFGITEGLLNWFKGATEQISIQLLKPGTSDACVEVCTFIQRVYFNAGLGAAGECTLCTFTGSTQTTHSTLVITNVFLELSLELLDKMVHHTVVK